MYVCVWLVKTLIFADASAPWRLSGAIITGVAVYALMTLFINRDAIRQCLTLVRRQV
jgi:hypothetical protein